MSKADRHPRFILSCWFDWFVSYKRYSFVVNFGKQFDVGDSVKTGFDRCSSVGRLMISPASCNGTCCQYVSSLMRGDLALLLPSTQNSTRYTFFRDIMWRSVCEKQAKRRSRIFVIQIGEIVEEIADSITGPRGYDKSQKTFGLLCVSISVIYTNPLTSTLARQLYLAHYTFELDASSTYRRI